MDNTEWAIKEFLNIEGWKVERLFSLLNERQGCSYGILADMVKVHKPSQERLYQYFKDTYGSSVIIKPTIEGGISRWGHYQLYSQYFISGNKKVSFHENILCAVLSVSDCIKFITGRKRKYEKGVISSSGRNNAKMYCLDSVAFSFHTREASIPSVKENGIGNLETVGYAGAYNSWNSKEKIIDLYKKGMLFTKRREVVSKNIQKLLMADSNAN